MEKILVLGMQASRNIFEGVTFFDDTGVTAFSMISKIEDNFAAVMDPFGRVTLQGFLNFKKIIVKNISLLGK